MYIKNLLVACFFLSGALHARADVPCWIINANLCLVSGGGDINLDPKETIKDIVRFFGSTPTGLPTPTALAAFVLDNPDTLLDVIRDPRYLAYLYIAQAIASGRNAALLNGAQPIPAAVRKALAGTYTPKELDSVRWTTRWNAVQGSLQAAQMWFNKDTQAITLINVVVFRDSAAVENIRVWAHELWHLRQYEEWGVLEFAKQWSLNSSIGGPVEAPAYKRGDDVVALLNASRIRVGQVMQTQMSCFERNASQSYCDLAVANTEPTTDFFVQADAWATGDGNRNGHMQLVMLANGEVCNKMPEATHQVDNDTRVTGDGYVCTIRLQPGEMIRVQIVAPNIKATAKYTRGYVQRKI